MVVVGYPVALVDGDVQFGRGVVVRGDVRVVNDGDGPLRIEDGTVLEH